VPIDVDFRTVVGESGTLMTTSATQRHEPARRGPAPSADRAQEIANAAKAEDGNEALAKFLIQHKLVPEQSVTAALAVVNRRNRAAKPDTLSISLIDEIVQTGGAELEPLLAGILERTKFAYVPLDYYEVDRQVVKMLPESITLGRLIVPFDVMSRTLMVAMANPMDATGKEAVQQLLDYNIQWHLAAPEAIANVLKQVYRLTDKPAAPAITFTTASAAPKPEAPAAAPPTPLPEIKVAARTEAPLAPQTDAPSTQPLPDTSAFRIKS
jgi:hypothetical protein